MELRKITPTDFDEYYLLVSNPLVMDMITGNALSLEEAKTRFGKVLAGSLLHPDFGYYKIIDKNSVFMGVIKLQIETENPVEAELGYMLLPEFWGKGIAGRMSARLTEKVKSDGIVKRLFAYIDPNNAASRKVLTNIGFRTIGLRKSDNLSSEILELNL